MFGSICDGNCDECLRQSQPQCKWVACFNGNVPDGAVSGGRDKDYEQLFVGRALHQGDLMPGKVKPTHHGLYVSWAGREHIHYRYEVLVSRDVAWKPCEGGEVPRQALVAGHTAAGESLYVGRAWHERNVLTPGKVVPSTARLHVPFNCVEITFDKYEILVLL